MAKMASSFGENEYSDWELTKKLGTVVAYKRFVSTYPNGTFSVEAKVLYHAIKEEKDWEVAVQRDRIFSYEKYLDQYPSGKYSEAAGIRLEALEKKQKAENLIAVQDAEEEELALESATNEDTVAAYNSFLKQFPSGKYKGQVKQRITQLEAKLAKQYRFIEEELQAWEYALSQDSLLSYRDFLHKFPYGRYSGIARTEMEKLERKVLDQVQKNQTEDRPIIPIVKSSEEDINYANLDAAERDLMGFRLSLLWLTGFTILSALTFLLVRFLFPVTLICALIAGAVFVYNRGERITQREKLVYQLGGGIGAFFLCWGGIKAFFLTPWISISLALIAGLLAIFLFRVYFNRQQREN